MIIKDDEVLLLRQISVPSWRSQGFILAWEERQSLKGLLSLETSENTT